MKDLLHFVLVAFVTSRVFTQAASQATTTQTTTTQATTTPAMVYVNNVCFCVTAGYCNLADGNTTTDGADQLDARIMTVSCHCISFVMFISIFHQS